MSIYIILLCECMNEHTHTHTHTHTRTHTHTHTHTHAHTHTHTHRCIRTYVCGIGRLIVGPHPRLVCSLLSEVHSSQQGTAVAEVVPVAVEVPASMAMVMATGKLDMDREAMGRAASGKEGMVSASHCTCEGMC